MNLHVQVRTSMGGTVQVPIWGKSGQIPLLVHLYSEKEEIKKNKSQFFAPTLSGLYKCTSSGSSLPTSCRTDGGG